MVQPALMGDDKKCSTGYVFAAVCKGGITMTWFRNGYDGYWSCVQPALVGVDQIYSTGEASRTDAQAVSCFTTSEEWNWQCSYKSIMTWLSIRTAFFSTVWRCLTINDEWIPQWDHLVTTMTWISVSATLFSIIWLYFTINDEWDWKWSYIITRLSDSTALFSKVWRWTVLYGKFWAFRDYYRYSSVAYRSEIQVQY